MNVYSAEQCQQLDQYVIQKQKTPGLLLMKKAAWQSYRIIEQHWPSAQKIKVVCGAGNNGGDGFMVAQYATLQNRQVQILIPEAIDTYETKLKGDALTVYHEAKQLNIDIQPFDETRLQGAGLIVDALFGTGLDRAITGHYQYIIETINKQTAPVLSMDVPSGINATTGAILGCAIQAERTVTFIGNKPGLLMHQGQEVAGTVNLATLDIEADHISSIAPIAQTHSVAYWLDKQPKRAKYAHKGNTGTALLIGGNQSMMGAIQLAGYACLKAGSGFTKVVTQNEHIQSLTAQTPELMCYDDEDLSGLLERANAIALGPGLGLDDWSQNLFQSVFNWQVQHHTPMVLDADALKWLANQSPTMPPNPNWVLTPHPGEAAKLLNISTQEVQSDRFKSIKALHQRYGGVIVLKGNGSLIFDGKRMELCPLGNPGMATGGMGDVLTGIIVSHLCQGLSTFDAACLGVYQHAKAADDYVEIYSQYSLTPSDVISYLYR